MKILKFSMVLLLSVTLWGCGKGNSNAPVALDPATKKHATGWAANGDGGAHPAAYFAAPASCKECHGEPTDPAGGISKVSCSNPGRSGVACHPSFPHAVGFAAFAVHGSVARDVAGGVTGMAHCQKCHGSTYAGDVGPSCIACHKGTNPSSNAPHAANWISGNANGLKHSATHISNAAACAQCHLGGANTPTSLKAHTPPAGLAPDCFNNTLCHGVAGHALPYVAGHQAAAKAALSSCQVSCHGTPAPVGVNPRFNQSKGTGVLNPNGCEGCHNKPGIAHPFMWLPGRGVVGQQTASHATAGTVNASCGQCHGNAALTGGSVAYPGGIVPPSCFPASAINGTTCHFSKPVDASGTTVGCGSCHGAPPNGDAVAGALSPNRAYRHTVHWALPGITAVTDSCNTCHNGTGYGVASHANGATGTAIPAKFNENGLTATWSVATAKCSNVSCHGGRLFTQLWTNTAVLNPAVTACASNCHRVSTVVPSAYVLGTATTPYIGPFSGNNLVSVGVGNNLHQAHLTGGFGATLCTDCHTTTFHYNNIMQGSRVLAPGFAAASVGGVSTKVGTYTYTSPTLSSCLTNNAACHDGSPRSWYK